MKEQLISFETAKLAKEKGFVSGSLWGYNNREILSKPYFGTIYYNLDDDNSVEYEAPTQSLLQKWLREKHSIHISINITSSGWDYEVKSIIPPHFELISSGVGFWESYEETLEDGLVIALKLVKL